MTEQSTPTQESAPEKAPNLDAVLEGAINQALPTEETPTPEEVKKAPQPDIPQKVDETNSEESDSDSLDQVAPESETEPQDSTEDPSDDADVFLIFEKAATDLETVVASNQYFTGDHLRWLSLDL